MLGPATSAANPPVALNSFQPCQQGKVDVAVELADAWIAGVDIVVTNYRVLRIRVTADEIRDEKIDLCPVSTS